MPAEIMNLSLPPWLRYDPNNMLCWMLIPSDMSSESQLKYFNHVVRHDLNPLALEGVPGPDGNVKAKLYGVTLDLKGKEKFLNQVMYYFFMFVTP